jgi:hypothetical protein
MAKKVFVGTAADISTPIFTPNPPPFIYTLKYKRKPTGGYGEIAARDRWTFHWDGTTGSVNRGVVHALSYFNTHGGTAGPEKVTLYIFVEVSPLEGATRKWLLEAEPRLYLESVEERLCTVAYVLDRSDASLERVGLATLELLNESTG